METIRIPVSEPFLGEEERRNVLEAIDSGWVSSKGKFITQFEEAFAAYCGTKYGVATSNGTTALHLALVALGIGEGDEVLVPSLTFVATANSVRYVGAKPIFVDSDPEYWCLDCDKIKERITENTRAIIPVHLYGHPCDMDAIMEIAQEHGLYVIEDAAEAHGAEYKGKKVGSIGHISCFSFYGNKIITTGEGGMCLTNDAQLAERIRILKDHGMNPERRYWHDVVGFNYRMTNLQAALGVAQLQKLTKFIERKREIGQKYYDLLADTPGIVLPLEMPWAKAVVWIYSFLVETGFRTDRDNLMKELADRGIETRPFFHPIHIMPPYQTGDSLPVAERLANNGISIPSSVTLKDKEIEEIAAIIRGNEA